MNKFPDSTLFVPDKRTSPGAFSAWRALGRRNSPAHKESCKRAVTVNRRFEIVDFKLELEARLDCASQFCCISKRSQETALALKAVVLRRETPLDLIYIAGIEACYDVHHGGFHFRFSYPVRAIRRF